MPSTTNSSRGEIALVRFVFADEQGAKRRPVLVLSSEPYHAGRQEVIVAALTSNTTRLLPGDSAVTDWREAGLPLPSLVTAILRTIKASMIERKLGRLGAADMRAVERSLRKVLSL
ncbi:MAG: type II toxin-antitoxin system PemK/MazF family toxin [Myxococcota bacterium]